MSVDYTEEELVLLRENPTAWALWNLVHTLPAAPEVKVRAWRIAWQAYLAGVRQDADTLKMLDELVYEVRRNSPVTLIVPKEITK